MHPLLNLNEDPIVFDPTWPEDMHLSLGGMFRRGEISVPLTWTPSIRPLDREVGIWKCILTDDELATRLVACRGVLKLPINAAYREVAELTLDDLTAAAESRARRRKLARPRKQGDEWTPERFRAAVVARCGNPRKQAGRHEWFRCCWHEDKDPSLEVDAARMVWQCWGCGKSGGWAAWQRLEKGHLS